MINVTQKFKGLSTFWSDLSSYGQFLHYYLRSRGYSWFIRFEGLKDVLVDVLYQKRGRYTKPFLHFGTIGLAFVMLAFGPAVLTKTEEDQNQLTTGPILTTAQAYAPDFYTLQAEEVRQYRGGEIIKHIVSDGETLSSIAQRYSLNVDTIIWENSLNPKANLKPGQELRILPVDGVRHKVQRGETIYTIGKKYGLDNSQVQTIVDYPFNEFVNNETFELAAGQYLMVPDGVVQGTVQVALPRQVTTARLTPDAGTVSATGQFIWPAAGGVTQGYRFFHKAFDIANRSGGPIFASDAGTVIAASWDSSGYGNRVIISHGNGYDTLYGHMSVLQVQPGQHVNRGAVIGQMGSTGRSTGVHLHFEVRNGASLLNPGNFLK
jgi:murein DD-endopeptidase MepM/ murein hydrolase activator NlpD